VTRRDWEKARRTDRARAAIARERRSPSAEAGRRPTSALSSALERVVDLKRRYVECFEFEHPYDPLTTSSPG
jgi:hypothetical protein